MSKVIKACFVKKREFLEGEQSDLSQGMAQSIYEETKIVIDELLSAAEEKAELIICQAEKKAAVLEEKVQAKAAQIRENTYQTEKQKGYEAGLAQGETEIKELALATQKIIQDLSTYKKNYFQENVAEIVDLWLTIVQKITQTVIKAQPEIIRQIMENILEEVSDAEKIIVRLNPLHLPYFKDEVAKEGKIKFVGDETITLGGCLLETENGFIDTQIEQQLALLQKAIKEAHADAGFC